MSKPCLSGLIAAAVALRLSSKVSKSATRNVEEQLGTRHTRPNGSEPSPAGSAKIVPIGSACWSDLEQAVRSADSVAVTHVIHPSQLTAGCVPTGANNDHFTGAGGEHIERFGEVDTTLTSSHGATSCAWDCADVSRALHSIAKITGAEHGDGVHEVLFTNRRAVVVPAGFVDKILQRTIPILEYNRVGNLYLAEVKLSSVTRQGQKR